MSFQCERPIRKLVLSTFIGRATLDPLVAVDPLSTFVAVVPSLNL